MEDVAASTQPLLATALILSHNSVEPLRRCLTALEASNDRERIEILVVDQGSRDGSQSIDSEFPNVTMLRLPRYFGATKARNIGVRTAKGEYVLLLAPEVEVEPGTIAGLVSVAQAELPGIVCPLLTDISGRPLPQMSSLPAAGVLEVAVLQPAGSSARQATDFASPRALLTRRQTIAGMNYFDERFGETWSDVDFFYRVRKGGKKILICSDLPVVDHGAPAPPQAMLAALEADRRIGASAYAGKHFGFAPQAVSYLKFLAGAPFSPGGFGTFSRMLSGQKIDGSELLG